MLQVALHAHRRIALPPETWVLVDAYRARLEFGDLTDPAGRERLADWLLARPKLRDLGLPPEDLRARVLAAPPTLGSALGVLLQGYAERFDKPRWGDKRPAYYRDVAAVLRLFPDAQFVHLVRDGRDCVASLQRMRWWKQGPLAAMATWVEAVDYGEHWRRTLGPGTWHEMRYETLVAEPERELRGLCAFLGEEYDDAMTAPDTVASVAVPSRKTWHTRTGGAMDSTRVSAYRTGLTAEELALLERVAGARLERRGYRLDGGGTVAPRLLADYAAVAARRRLAHRKQHALDLVRDRRAGAPVAARLTSAQLARPAGT